MSRRDKKSVKAGCGYRANVSSGKVTIYPTRNNKTCSVTLGLGDATFTFDPYNPPDTIKRIITKDSDGKYTPQILPIPNRCVKLFSDVEDVHETFTDADGKTTKVEMKRLKNFRIDVAQSGDYKATGVQTISSFGGRTIENGSSTIFSGSLPYNIQLSAIQLFTIRGGYAYLDSDGYVNVVRDDAAEVARFNIGENYIEDKFITEFTVKSDSSTFICRNAYGYAVEVYCPFSHSGYFNHGDIHEDIIRVACGKMLKQAYDGIIEKSVLTDDGYAIAIGENDVIDIAPDGSGGVREIKLSDGSNEYFKVIDEYTLNTNNELLYRGNKIASNIFGFGVASQSSLVGLTLGKDGKVSEAVQKSAIEIFKSRNVYDSWSDEYIKWYSEQKLPVCDYAGVGETETTTRTSLQCFKKSYNPNNYAVARAIIAINEDGKVYVLNGTNLEEQPLLELDNKGFDAINKVSQNGKVISFREYSIGRFYMPDVEVGVSQDNHFFRF